MGDTRTILVTDDEAALTVVVEMLSSVDGHDVVTVVDGCEALPWSKEHTPDLAILDVAKPSVSERHRGLFACEACAAPAGG